MKKKDEEKNPLFELHYYALNRTVNLDIEEVRVTSIQYNLKMNKVSCVKMIES